MRSRAHQKPAGLLNAVIQRTLHYCIISIACGSVNKRIARIVEPWDRNMLYGSIITTLSRKNHDTETLTVDTCTSIHCFTPSCHKASVRSISLQPQDEIASAVQHLAQRCGNKKRKARVNTKQSIAQSYLHQLTKQEITSCPSGYCFFYWREWGLTKAWRMTLKHRFWLAGAGCCYQQLS